MRKSLFALLVTSCVAALAVTGCSAPTDSTMNRMDTTQSDPNYPAGPYGYVEGSTVADYQFLGKIPADGNYDALPMRQLLLGTDYHSDPSTKLLLLEGSANWCYFCNQEAPNVEKLAVDHAADGFKALTVLAEGEVQGEPASQDDIATWVSAHSFKTTGMGIDPEARLFLYAPASAFPLHILLDTTTMKIKWLCVGGIGACDTETAVTDALSVTAK